MTPTSNTSVSPRRRARRTVACAALLLPLLAGPRGVLAAPPAEGTTFRPTVPYVLRIAGKPAPGAKIYASDPPGAFLILSPQLSGPVLVDVHARTVATLAAPPADGADGTLKVTAGAASRPQGRFEVQGTSPSFTLDGKPVQLEYPGPLLGRQELAAIRAYNPEYARRAAAYRPDPAALARLAAVHPPVELRVYFATWCPVCTQSLPKLMKVLDSLKGAPFAVDYYGLPEDKNADPEPARMHLKGLPTAIIFRGGKELGRLTNQQWQQPEVALAAILVPGR